MMAWGVIARVRRILQTAHAAATNEAIARASPPRGVGHPFAVAASHIPHAASVDEELYPYPTGSEWSAEALA